MVGPGALGQVLYRSAEIAEWIEAAADTRQRLAQAPRRKSRRPRRQAPRAWTQADQGRRRRLRALSAKKRHKLRIRAKNLRYAVEFFAGAFPGEENAKRREAALTALRNSRTSSAR